MNFYRDPPDIEGNSKLSFFKNFALLVYYGLIQFRNYQANNFNILFLAFSCQVMKRYLSPIFNTHITKVLTSVYRNYDKMSKSSEQDLFLGKSGKN